MTNILLIRHAETGVGVTQQQPYHDIDELGRKQTQRLANRLVDYGISGVFTSSYQRAVSTAELIAQRLGLRVVQDERLVEIPLWISPAELHDQADKQFQEAAGIVEGAQKKTSLFLENIISRHRGQTLVVITHGNLIRALLGKTLEMGLETIVRLNVMNTSLSILEWVDEGGQAPFFRLERFNDVAHLE